MDIKALTGKVQTFLGKYKYAAIVLVIGLVLLLLPSNIGQTKQTVAENTPNDSSLYLDSETLAQILQSVDGAGEVKVLLSIASGERTYYQTNNDIDNATDGTNTKIETVIISDSQHNEAGLITQIDSPIYLGAIVVCEGADSAAVRLAITQAVAKITGLNTDGICVLKMK